MQIRDKPLTLRASLRLFARRSKARRSKAQHPLATKAHLADRVAEEAECARRVDEGVAVEMSGGSDLAGRLEQRRVQLGLVVAQREHVLGDEARVAPEAVIDASGNVRKAAPSYTARVYPYSFESIATTEQSKFTLSKVEISDRISI